MPPAGEPRWRRRKADRPGEIIAAALDVFSERGFAAARLDDVAKRAGLSKGALYLYFETKEDLFRAVVGEAAGANLAHLERAVEADLPFEQAARAGRAVCGDHGSNRRRSPKRSSTPSARMNTLNARICVQLSSTIPSSTISRSVDTMPSSTMKSTATRCSWR